VKIFFVSLRNINHKLSLKISVATIALIFVLFSSGTQFLNIDFTYGQILDNEHTKTNITNSSHFPSNSTSSQNSKIDGLVLLRQKLNNASFGYRVLGGQKLREMNVNIE
jgi:hypothetical protein